MGNKEIVGIVIVLLVIGGLVYYFTRKEEEVSPEEIEMQEFAATAQDDAEVHRRMDAFAVRADEFRKQTSKLTAREALPFGLKNTLYAFTEEVRTIDPKRADVYYAEFCEGRAKPLRTLRVIPVSKVSLSRSPETAPLDTDMRDNKDSAFGGFALDAGQFVVSHTEGARAFSEFAASNFDSAHDSKRARRNPLNTQEKTKVDENNSGFDASITHNNRDDTGMGEASLSGNKRKLDSTVSKLGAKVSKTEGPRSIYRGKRAKAILSTHEEFDKFDKAIKPVSDNTVKPNVRHTGSQEALTLQRRAPSLPTLSPGPNFTTVEVPQEDKAGDERATLHTYLQELGVALSALEHRYDEARFLEVKALLDLIHDTDPSMDISQYQGRVARARSTQPREKKKRSLVPEGSLSISPSPSPPQVLRAGFQGYTGTAPPSAWLPITEHRQMQVSETGGAGWLGTTETSSLTIGRRTHI
jgi:hypothetical protein